MIALKLQYMIQMSSAKRRENHLALKSSRLWGNRELDPGCGFSNAGNRPRRNSTPNSTTTLMAQDNLHS